MYPIPSILFNTCIQRGQFVKVQISGIGILSIAEMQAFSDTVRPIVDIVRGPSPAFAASEIRLSADRVSFTLSSSQRVVLDAFDMTGKLAGQLIDKRFLAGNHALSLSAPGKGQGVLLYELSIGGRVTMERCFRKPLRLD